MHTVEPSTRAAQTLDPATLPSAESVDSGQLHAGFRWLRFAEPTLEWAYRTHHFQRLRRSVRTHLWLGISLLLAFLVIDYLVLQRALTPQLIALRIVAVGCLALSTWVTSSRADWARHYQHWLLWLAPALALCTVANEFIDQPMGVSFVPTIVLTIMGTYLLVGLLFVPALCAGLAVLTSYVLAGLFTDMPRQELIYNGAVLLFTNIIGATACYTLEHLQRTSFLEARALADVANRDGLTGTHNRRALDEHLSKLWQQGTREQVPVALLLIDIDYFKAYNDFYGHQAGDQCLRQVAGLLSRLMRRPLDFSARYGGEEFAVLLYNCTREFAEHMAVQIQLVLEQAGIQHAAAPHGRLTVSIGAVCVVPQPERSTCGLVQLADEALYQAKHAGRDRWIMVEPDYALFTTGVMQVGDTPVRRTG